MVVLVIPISIRTMYANPLRRCLGRYCRLIYRYLNRSKRAVAATNFYIKLRIRPSERPTERLSKHRARRPASQPAIDRSIDRSIDLINTRAQD